MPSLDTLLDGLVIGAHLVSAHSSPGLNNTNPGLYVRTESGFTAGAYENSISRTRLNGNDGSRRTSAYLGWTLETPGRNWALTLGAVNGYGHDEQRTCVPNDSPPIGKSKATAAAAVQAPEFGCSSSTYQPRVRDVLPLVVASGRVPLAEGWAARVGYLYVPAATENNQRMHIANLMIEHRWR